MTGGDGNGRASESESPGGYDDYSAWMTSQATGVPEEIVGPIEIGEQTEREFGPGPG